MVQVGNSMLYYRNKRSNKKHYIRLAGLLLIISLGILSPKTSQLTSKVSNIITAPFAELSSFVSSSFVSVVDSMFGTKANRDLVNKLTIENQDLINKINTLESVVSESQELKEEFEFRNNIKGIEAKITMLNNDEYYKKFNINKGSVNGVKVGDIVVRSYSDDASNIKGALVGLVEEVFPTSATVSSIMDETYNIVFYHNETKINGIIDNRIDGNLNAYMLDEAELKPGDKIFTAGTGGRYRRGIYIGEVLNSEMSEDRLRQLVTIKSPVKFSKLYNVFVIEGDN